MIHFEARSIEFHFTSVSQFGSRRTFPIEVAPPELEGTFRTDEGAYGTVAVPLTDDERATIQAVVASASQRALALAGEHVFGQTRNN